MGSNRLFLLKTHCMSHILTSKLCYRTNKSRYWYIFSFWIINVKRFLCIIKDFRTIVFIFIIISTTFRPICPPAFFRCLPNSGTFTELQTTSFTESTGVTYSYSVSHNRVQVLSTVDSIKDVVWSSAKVTKFDKHLKKAGGHISQNIVEITIKMKTIVWKPLMIKIIKLRIRNLDN